MSESAFHQLEEVIQDPLFPEVDLALRAGRHIDRDDGERYAFVMDAQSLLEMFYRRYGCELVHASDGFVYLLPVGDRMGRRQLTAGEMLVGQTLALVYLEPATVQAGGLTQQSVVISRLASVVGERDLIQALNPRRRKYDERIALAHLREARDLLALLRKHASQRDAAKSNRDDHMAARDQADKDRARAIRARDAAQESHTRAAQGLANTQRGLEELARRAAEHRMAVQHLADARRLLPEQTIDPTDIGTAMKAARTSHQTVQARWLQVSRTLTL